MASAAAQMDVRPVMRIVPRGGLCDQCEVRGTAACAVLDDHDLSRLEAIATHKEYEAGQTVFDEGDDPRHMFNVTSGMIRLFKLLPNGRRQIVGFVFPGDMLGLATHGTYTCSAEAIGSVTVCRFPREKLIVLLDEFPHLQGRLLDMAADELKQAQDQMLLLGRKSPMEKVASFLLRLRGEHDQCNENGDRLDLAMGRGDIADYLGLTIETVSRTFTKLRNENVIALEGAHHVIITDEDALEDLADAMGD